MQIEADYRPKGLALTLHQAEHICISHAGQIVGRITLDRVKHDGRGVLVLDFMPDYLIARAHLVDAAGGKVLAACESRRPAVVASANPPTDKLAARVGQTPESTHRPRLDVRA